MRAYREPVKMEYRWHRGLGMQVQVSIDGQHWVTVTAAALDPKWQKALDELRAAHKASIAAYNANVKAHGHVTPAQGHLGDYGMWAGDGDHKDMAPPPPACLGIVDPTAHDLTDTGFKIAFCKACDAKFRWGYDMAWEFQPDLPKDVE